jgi:hypothetical protein
MIGATQNSQSCWIAHPPTNTAGPVFRAGFRWHPETWPMA